MSTTWSRSIVKEVIEAVTQEGEAHRIRLAAILPHSPGKLARALKFAADSGRIKRIRHETIPGVRGMPMAVFAPVAEAPRYSGPKANSVWDYASKA